tara:strand:- start:19 stop:216 length:198 start_codon:yes stop_codon:yes gene_type:complete
MRNIFDKEFVKEMDDFFAEIDRVIGKKPQPEKCCTICELPGDGCGANEPTEAEWLESKAELHFER